MGLRAAGLRRRPGARYPAVYVIQGYTGHVAMWANRPPYRQPFVETADAVFAAGQAPPCIVVYVDAWTAYGGSQFVDSPGTGAYHSYLCDEVVPWVDERYRTIADRASRAITGKSCGGFGAMITPMLRPDLFGALATPRRRHPLRAAATCPSSARRRGTCASTTATSTRGGTDFRSRTAFTKQARRDPADDARLLRLLLGRATTARPELPFDPRTGRAATGGLAALARLGPGAHGRAVRRRAALAAARSGSTPAPATSGTSTWAPRRSATSCGAIGVPEERRALRAVRRRRHGGIDYRYPLALAWLANRLAR